jgi:hypothetical protein
MRRFPSAAIRLPQGAPSAHAEPRMVARLDSPPRRGRGKMHQPVARGQESASVPRHGCLEFGPCENPIEKACRWHPRAKAAQVFRFRTLQTHSQSRVFTLSPASEVRKSTSRFLWLPGGWRRGLCGRARGARGIVRAHAQGHGPGLCGDHSSASGPHQHAARWPAAAMPPGPGGVERASRKPMKAR